MEVTRTADAHAHVVLTAEELTTLAVEALATGGAAIFQGAVRAKLSVFRRSSEMEDGTLLYRLKIRPEPQAELPNDRALDSIATPSPLVSADSATDPTADPALDACSAGTEL